MAGSEQLGSKTSRTIGDSLIRAADSLGQIDLSMMWGRGAAKLPDGKVVYHLGDRLLVDGTGNRIGFRPIANMAGGTASRDG